MRRIPPIKAVMTPFPNSIEIDQPVRVAREMMNEQNIRHLPVMQKGDLVGVVTDLDLRLALDPRRSEGTGAETRIRDIYVRPTYIVDLSEPLDRVLIYMATHHLDSALVVKDRKLVGIFTMTDACRSFGELLQTLFPAGGDDRVA